MPFVRIAGITGKVYVPEKSRRAACKHPCPDCYSCQLCSDDRCNVCRGAAVPVKRNRERTQCRLILDGKERRFQK